MSGKNNDSLKSRLAYFALKHCTLEVIFVWLLVNLTCFHIKQHHLHRTLATVAAFNNNGRYSIMTF